MLYPGTDIPVYDFIKRMYPDPATRTSFKYPSNRLLPLQGVIEEDELRRPQMLDDHGEPCLIVIKNSCTTGVTIGCATGANSFVREYFPNGRQETSMEWAILPYNHKSGAFSAPGDSGAIIVDGKGRIGVSSPAVPARRSPPISRTQRLSTGSCSVSRPASPMPTSISPRPRRCDIDPEDVGDAGEAVRGENVSFLFLLALALHASIKSLQYTNLLKIYNIIYACVKCDFFSYIHAPLSTDGCFD
jgi:hypothetical protein